MSNPYHQCILFLLRERHGKLWPIQSENAVTGWMCTRMLAYGFDKLVTDVARDIVIISRSIEEDRARGRQIS